MKAFLSTLAFLAVLATTGCSTPATARLVADEAAVSADAAAARKAVHTRTGGFQLAIEEAPPSR